MTKRLTLICHGASEATRRSAFPSDTPLEPGADDALRKAGFAAGHGTAVVVSPSRAARETAQALGLDGTEDRDIDDLDCGAWAGLAISELARRDPQSLAAWIGDADFREHGGESLRQLLARAERWLQRQAEAESHVVAVTHAAFVKCLAIAVLDAPLTAFWALDIAPASVTDLRHDGRRWAIRACGCPIAAMS